ncbi:MAG: peptidase, partial [Ignavibacteria bacterium]|nr:peptidase [Ignavibacteria bacterium]
MDNSGYKRFPTIHNDKVVFVSEDDLWEVNVNGGTARRLTSNLGEVTNPYYSPDGNYVAFSGKEEGEKDVYIIPSNGGANKRITYSGKNTRVIGWSTDSKYILFCSDVKAPFQGRNEIYRISLEGGIPEKLKYGVANNISFGPNGEVLLGKNTLDPARWKRYKGGTAGVFWIDRKGNGKFEKFLKDIGGNLASPMWINDRIYFICDHEGLGKLYSCNLKGSDIKSHSDNKEYYVRNATTDGKKIVYHAGSEIFEYDIESNEEKKINIEYYSPQIQRQRKFIQADKYLQDYNLNPDGNSTLITSRGKSFYFSNCEGPVIQFGKQHGVRYRQTQWLSDKKSIVTISDDGGSEAVEVHSVSDNKKKIHRIEIPDIGIIARMKVSPRENKIAVSNNRHQLFLIDIKTEKITEIAKSKFERTEDFSFSPDGNLIAYSMSDANYLSSIYLYDISMKENHQITTSGFRDFQPTFDPEGRYIYFLSAREFNPVYDTSFFQLGFPLGVRPYLLSLNKDVLSPFTQEYSRLFSKKKSKSKKDDNGKKEVEKIVVDYDNIQERIISFPLPEKNYFQIQAVKDGIVYSREPIKGALHHWYWEKHPSDEALERFDFNTQKTENIAKKVESFKISADGKSLIYRTENKLFLKADIFEENEFENDHSEHSDHSDHSEHSEHSEHRGHH